MRKIINSAFVSLDGVTEDPRSWAIFDSGSAEEAVQALQAYEARSSSLDQVLLLVVQSRHEIFDDGGFHSARRSRRRAPRYPREGASE